MTEQFVNPEAEKLEDEIVPPDAEQKIQKIAEEAAGKAAKSEQKYDEDHQIFSK